MQIVCNSQGPIKEVSRIFLINYSYLIDHELKKIKTNTKQTNIQTTRNYSKLTAQIMQIWTYNIHNSLTSPM